jgi:hypothetical protein
MNTIRHLESGQREPRGGKSWPLRPMDGGKSLPVLPPALIEEHFE